MRRARSLRARRSALARVAGRREDRRSVAAAPLAALACALALSIVSRAAHAQDAPLDAAERQLEEAQFEGAAEILAELDGSDVGLSRDDVARLLRLRAVVSLALGRDAEVRVHLLGLASVLDGREPGALPPQLRRQYTSALTEVHGAPRARLRIESAETGLRAVLEIDRDPGGLVRDTELSCVVGGEEVARANALSLELPGLDDVECRGRARGPGGFEVASATARRSGAGAVDGGGGDELWPWIVGGIGAAVLTAVIIGIAVAASGPRSVSGPVWMP